MPTPSPPSAGEALLTALFGMIAGMLAGCIAELTAERAKLPWLHPRRLVLRLAIARFRAAERGFAAYAATTIASAASEPTADPRPNQAGPALARPPRATATAPAGEPPRPRSPPHPAHAHHPPGIAPPRVPPRGPAPPGRQSLRRIANACPICYDIVSISAPRPKPETNLRRLLARQPVDAVAIGHRLGRHVVPLTLGDQQYHARRNQTRHPLHPRPHQLTARTIA